MDIKDLDIEGDLRAALAETDAFSDYLKGLAIMSERASEYAEKWSSGDSLLSARLKLAFIGGWMECMKNFNQKKL